MQCLNTVSVVRRNLLNIAHFNSARTASQAPRSLSEKTSGEARTPRHPSCSTMRKVPGKTRQRRHPFGPPSHVRPAGQVERADFRKGYVAVAEYICDSWL